MDGSGSKLPSSDFNNNFSLLSSHVIQMSIKGNHRIAITTSLRLKPTIQPKKQLDTQSSLFASFANVLDDKQTQLKCYSDTDCADTVEQFLKGRNCTLFVYGQTGSGKVCSYVNDDVDY